MAQIETDISRLTFETKLIEGAFERLPQLGADPMLWAIVEQRLGHGVGCRLVEMTFVSLSARRGKPVVFQPPSWWQIEDRPETIFDTFDDYGDRIAEHREPMKSRRDGGLVIEADRMTSAVIRIEGQPLDIEATEAYALAYFEAMQAKGTRLPLKYDAALRPIAQARLSR